MAIIMDKGCIEAIYGLIGWKGLTLMHILVQPHLTTKHTLIECIGFHY